ncbi:MAG: hypothetical protein EZS28_047508, partial [Streblomastix strix]
SHYGSEDPEDVSAVKEMYKIIGLEKTWETFEMESINGIRKALIELRQMENMEPASIVLEEFLDQIAKRKK